jgi:drug/metabolite transporter (DMT)-like permease
VPADLRAGMRWELRFALLALTWGSSFLLIKVGLETFAPVQVAVGRLALGALVLGAVLGARRQPLPRGLRVWLHLAVAGLFLNALPFSLFGYAETRIPSLLAGIVNAAAPLVTAAVAAALVPDERPGPRRLAGLLVGLVGVAVLLGAWRGAGTGSLRASWRRSAPPPPTASPTPTRGASWPASTCR